MSSLGLLPAHATAAAGQLGALRRFRGRGRQVRGGRRSHLADWQCLDRDLVQPDAADLRRIDREQAGRGRVQSTSQEASSVRPSAGWPTF
jgi:hypothetical protein